MTIIHMIILVLMPSMALMALLLCKRSFVRDKSFHIQSGPPLRSAGGDQFRQAPKPLIAEWWSGSLAFSFLESMGISGKRAHSGHVQSTRGSLNPRTFTAKISSGRSKMDSDARVDLRDIPSAESPTVLPRRIAC
jgi:hypothetical protein